MFDPGAVVACDDDKSSDATSSIFCRSMKVRRCTALERIQVHDGSRSALGPQGFDMDIPLQLGHVLTNEPGFCKYPCSIHVVDGSDIVSASLTF